MNSRTSNHKHALLMDKIYSIQRFFYDYTRIFFLWGRETALKNINVNPSDNLLEVGTGTARNLIKLAKRYPQNTFFGLDASQQMLKTAQTKVNASDKQQQIKLVCELAENVKPTHFALKNPFDIILFSYSICMIPEWKKAIDNALMNLKSNGILYITDFGDLSGFPKPISYLIKKFLKMHFVVFRQEVLDYLYDLERQGKGKINFQSIFGGYAFLLQFKKKEL